MDLMSKTYQVTMEADFITEGSSPGDINKRLLGLIAKAGFKESNFEIGVSRLPSTKGGKVEETAPKPTIGTIVRRVIKTTKTIKKVRKSRRHART